MALKLRSRGSHLATLPEGIPPKRRMAWVARITYFLLLAAVIAYLGYFGALRLWNVSGEGVIEPDTLEIKAHERAILTDIGVQVGDGIKRGQKLFVMHVRPDDPQPRLDPYALERVRVARDVMAREAQLAAHNEQLARIRKRLSHLESLRVLELNRERYAERLRLESEAEDMRTRIDLARGELAALKKLQKDVGALELPEPVLKPTRIDYIAPVSGSVLAIERTNHEYVQEGDRIMVLKDPQRMRVRGYFALDSLRFLRTGKRVEIEYPDGTAGAGMIRRISSAANDLPEKLRHDYTPAEISVKVDIEPLDADAQRLRRFENLNIRLRTERWE